MGTELTLTLISINIFNKRNNDLDISVEETKGKTMKKMDRQSE